jgi:outer membrane receptor for monomeric catechols
VVTSQKTSLNLLPDTILNTPQTIDVVAQKLIQEQGVNNLEDALKNVPGITLNAGEGGTHGDLVNLRGYPVTDRLSLVLNGYNLANAYYYTNAYFSSPMENHVVPGVGRTFLLTANLSF